MKSTACVCILKLQASESRFKLFCSYILIMAKLPAKRKLCWLVFYGITLTKKIKRKNFTRVWWINIYWKNYCSYYFWNKEEADYHNAKTKKRQVTISKQRRDRMLNVLLLLFQKIIELSLIIKLVIRLSLSICRFGWWLMLYWTDLLLLNHWIWLYKTWSIIKVSEFLQLQRR